MNSAAQIADLPDDMELLKQRYHQDTARLQLEIKLLREQMNLLKAKRFGRSSEQVSPDQLALFNEAELTVLDEEDEELRPQEPEQTTEVPAHTRTRGKRSPLPEHLPRVDVLHDLSAEEKVCPCGCGMQHIRDEISEQLDIIPAKVQVLRHIRRVYACKSCEETIRQAKLPPQPIPKSNASPGLLAHIVTSKFVDGTPLHRQEAQFSRIGFELARGTTARWVIRLGEGLIVPLLNRFDDTLSEYPVRHLDETTLQVLKEAGRKAESKSYIWLQKGGPPDRPVVLYQYQPSRAHTVPLELLEEAEGYVQVDGYEAYDVVAGKNHSIMLVGCWAHARRKFDEVIKGVKNAKPGKAHKALAFIRKLYAIEKRLKTANADPAEIYRVRQQEARPVLEEMRTWLNDSRGKAPPKSLLGKALGYLDNQWPKLVRYLEDGRLHIDNNAAERAIRPFVIGRKNWLFADTPNGASASANLYSLVETAKLNGLEPYAYLRHVFTELPMATTLEEVDALLPWNIDAGKLIAA